MEGELSTKNLILVLGTIFIFIIGCCVGCPAYNVYRARMTGKAEYERAEQNRRIQVLQSQAKMQAAQYEAAADTLRAHGISRSNAIINQTLSPLYIQWLWVNNMENQDKSVIYVPSEQLGLPILEAGRLQQNGVPTTDHNNR